jgi:PBSX family phage terminase large subunit
MYELFSKKQLEFISAPKKKWNIAHGAVRTGKTVSTSVCFLNDMEEVQGNENYISGFTFETAYRNVIEPMLYSPQFVIFRPFLTWSGKKLYYKDKTVTVLGAKDEGAIKNFQGPTATLFLCDEMTLYPEPIIDMIDTRLSRTESRGYATMNPSHPGHKVKKWIDLAEQGDPDYYAMHWMLEDNPFVDQAYKDRLKKSLSGIFYKRNYLGQWCVAEGAVFDFFDRSLHVVEEPPFAAEYWIAGIDYGASNPFACVLIGVNTGRYTKQGYKWWVEKEYFWNPKEMRQKTNSEYISDLQQFLGAYDVKQVYIDPSAAAFKIELRRAGFAVCETTNNEVIDGIGKVADELMNGNLVICSNCKNLIREIESYVWDERKAALGKDAPKKKDDHLLDSLRYSISTHIIPKLQALTDYHDPQAYANNRFSSGGRRSHFF